ncbi:hypothetical protein [Streptomyces sp. TS71-3]|uniref:hypothetical protein n=1 Tax=Streptomyces sp. TS71-3 TaxID=2733862 RepID=UPI001BB3DA06|nr:hypothetical protein [Streptomyces sp. TS71-3]
MRRSWRAAGALAACGLLLGACTGAGHGTGGTPSPDPGTPDTPGTRGTSRDATAPRSASAGRIDAARLPRTAAQARALVRGVIADPELFGSGAVRATPYESDPDTWPVLGDDCAWQPRGLPGDVLATLTRYMEMPDGRGRTAGVTVTVTVHRTALDAAWQQAGVLDETMRCPDQTPASGERLTGMAGLTRLTGLSSSASAYGEGANLYSDDVLRESGDCRGGESGGTFAYYLRQAAYGPVVVSAAACGGQAGKNADGPTVEPVQACVVAMVGRVKLRIGRPAPGGSGTPAPSGPGTPGTPAGKPSGKPSVMEGGA